MYFQLCHDFPYFIIIYREVTYHGAIDQEVNMLDTYNIENEEDKKRSERKNMILEFMSVPNYKPARFKELCYIFNVSEEDRDELLVCLNELEDEARIVKTKNNRYMPMPENVMVGTYIGNKRSFGFVKVEGREEDLFIHDKNSLNAFHGDTVLVQLDKRKTGPRTEARIIRIIKREITELIGIFQACDGYGFVIPNNKKIADDIFVPEKASKGAVTGNIVIVEIRDYGNDKKSPTGKVTEILGHVDDPSSDIIQVVRALNIPEEFPQDVEDQLNEIPDTVSEEDKKGRRDFRDLLTVTIDGEDAKDLDDAISLSYEDGVYHLGVHIADVSNYVRENSPLDKEALKRGTSCYLADSVIPMIPHKLSNGICSLNHDTDRLTLSCVMDIDDKGKIISHEVCEGLINVNERMNYSDVYKILERSDEGLLERYKDFVPMFDLMKELSLKLRNVRKKRGAIDFDLPETDIVCDENHNPIDIKPHERNTATMLIEDFMLAANETIAEDYFWEDIPFEYRIHESPDMEKVDKLKVMLRSLGIFLKTGKDNIHPKEFQKVLKQIEGLPFADMITKVTLRSMQQARYSTECEGHFGLACKYYCHFTSPIRRYPDLMIHRIIKENLHGTLDDKRRKHYAKILPDIAADNSAKERRADDAERDVTKLKEIEYMSEHIGEVFTGSISGFTNMNIFVELDNTVEGCISLASIRDDFYNYFEDKYMMVGERTKKTYVLGDKVKIKVVNCDKIDRVIDFEFADEED